MSTIKSTNQSSLNESNYHYYFYKTEQLTFLCILFIIILVGNVSVLITLIISKKRKSRMNFFIMHLAIADLLVGLISVLTDIIWRLTVDFYGGDLMCKVIKFSSVLVTYSSTYVLVSVSIDRYDAVTNPLNFSTSWSRARRLVIISWILSFLFAIPSAFLNSETEVKGHIQCWITLTPLGWRLYLTLIAFTLFFIPAIIITVCYCTIVHVIWSKSNLITENHHENYCKSETMEKILSPLSSSSSSSQLQQSKYPNSDYKAINLMTSEDDVSIMKSQVSSRGVIPKAKIKTIKMTLVIVLVFILCWSPYFVWDLLQVYGFIPNNQTTVAISTFIQSMAPLNSAANPIIYGLFSTSLCKRIKSRL
ncbi:cardioacceleratory peptide receptor-like [Panonychus citri]|uniref:cardioacceleratory peptide receptor-like n=1 Tax=Panonychus citri TaxID=50023 RepID=UPI00230754C0|nr:cardioacceleratory peptide receptor-like [Panonychus citri]